MRTRFPDAPSGYHRAAEAARKIGNYKLARKLLLSLEYGEQDRDDELIVKKNTLKGYRTWPPNQLNRTNMDQSYFQPSLRRTTKLS
ncbi:hypothetical protein BMR06_17420 [Methylococcaceae bacterium HT5]|nr:hypothetical protein BMR06_17420 [Methylococcaceae bacterium HT5]